MGNKRSINFLYKPTSINLTRRLTMISAVMLSVSSCGIGRLAAQNADIPPDQPVSCVKDQISQLDNQIGNLLMKLPVGSDNTATPAEMQETYRLIIRHLYESALLSRDSALRSRMVLTADQLFAGLADFDKQMNSLLADNGANAGPTAGIMAQACQDFYQASKQVNNEIKSLHALHYYLHKMLKPLAPLAQTEFVGISAPVVWPVLTGGQQAVVNTPATTSSTPDIAIEISSLQQADMMPQMRQVLRQILTQLQAGLANASTHRQNEMYYQIILQCVNLAAHLQQSAVLTEDAREQFNHRLLLGLLFFKDPRTRDAAAQKLKFIGTIVNSMEFLRTAPLPVQAQRTITQRVHDIIVNMQSGSDANKYGNQLKRIDSFLLAQRNFTVLLQQTHAIYTNTAWQRISDNGHKDLLEVITVLSAGFDHNAIMTYINRMAQLSANLNRLAAMPGAAQQAMLYHPLPHNGVELNMERWARRIGMKPYETSTSAADFDRFNKVLSLLAATHLEMAAHGPQKLLQTLSGGRYDLFVTQFLQTQHELADSLAQPQGAPNQLIQTLMLQRLVFKTSSQMAFLLTKGDPLMQLNQWAAWYCDKQTVKTILNQFEQSVSAEFRSATGMHDNTSDAWAKFTATAPAIIALAKACENLLPQLNAPQAAWSTGWLQAYSPPPSNAIYRRDFSRFSQACMFFNSAEFNSTHGHAAAALTMFSSALTPLTK